MKKALLIIFPIIIALIAGGVVWAIANKNDAKGALQVTSSPASQVYLDDKYIGKTPLCRCEATEMLQVGDHSLKLVPQGDYPTFEEHINVVESVLTVVDRTFGKSAYSEGSIITLKKLSDSSQTQILIVSAPDNASVSIDNVAAGKTPLLVKSITESDHEIKISKDGYRDKVLQVHTITGYELSAKIYLGVNPNILTPSAAPTPTSALTPTPTAPTQKVTILQTPTGFLRVRAQPSVSSAEVGQVTPGQNFDLVLQQSGWYQIKLNDGTLGWVSSQYAQLQ